MSKALNTQYYMKNKTILFFLLLGLSCPFLELQAQTDLPITTYGPSQGRIPGSYATQINNNLSNLNYSKFYANKAIEYFLDDNCPLPRNLYGDFKDENGNDAPSMYRANEGCNSFMNALFNLYLTHPNDEECKGYLDRVILFADCMLQYGTDRYGAVHSPQLASILIRDDVPYVPFDPENPGQGVRIEQRNVWSYSANNIVYNYCAISLGNIWYDSDESHKASWRGTDVEANNDLYTLLYSLSRNLNQEVYPDRDKYKKAADASLAYWVNNCQTESNMYPWGEHAGWDFYKDEYNKDYYHAPLHEYKGGFRTNLDKLIENQARVRPNELTSFEKYAAGLRAAHTADADPGRRYNGHILEGTFMFCRHGTLWADRLTARYQADNHDIGGYFGCFPKHIGSYIYIMALAYNRSRSQALRDSLAINLNYFLDGLEAQRTIYTDNKYYPYGNFNWYAYPTGSLSASQNGDLGIFAKRASVLMNGLDENIKQKMLTVAQNTNIATNYPYNAYPGPEFAVISAPQDGYQVHKIDTVELNWLPSEGAVKYRIYLSDSEHKTALATADSTVFVTEVSDLKYIYRNLSLDKTYYWAVDAVGAQGDITKGNIQVFQTSSENPTTVQSVVIEPSSLDLNVYETATLIPSFLPQNASNKFVEWESSDNTIVEVDLTGKITAKLPGNAVISAISVDEKVTGVCNVTVNALAQNITFNTIPTQYLSENKFLKLEANASSDLPVGYDLVSGPAILQQELNSSSTLSAYINGSTLTSQSLLRLKVDGMDALFKMDISGIDLSNAEHAVFEYATIVDGHRRNYDVNVNMVEYPATWNAGDSPPNPINTSPVCSAIIQPKIALESDFGSYEEYISAYQTPIQLDITDFVRSKIAANQTEFCIALQASKVNTDDGQDYIRVASHAYSEAELRPKIRFYSDGNGDALKLTGLGLVTVKAKQLGSDIYFPADDVFQTFEVKDINSGIASDVYKPAEIYPNPLKNTDLNIVLTETLNCTVNIYKSTSETIFSKSYTTGNKQIRIPREIFSPGFYIVSVITEKGILNYKLMVK